VIYDDQFTSSISWSIDLSPTGQNVQYRSEQQRETHIDSWGTLITPFDTFHNVVRMRSLIHRQDSLITDTLSVPIDITQVEYMWFDTTYKLPVLTANGIVTDSLEVLGTIEYLYDSNCEAPTWSLSIASDTFYLDSTGSVTIDFTIDDPNADEYTWDWGDGQFEMTTGSTSHTFHAAGPTSVGITGCMTHCLPLNSCSFDIVDFVILDTLSSIPILDASQVGIRWFPNPAKEKLIIEVPAAITFDRYRLIDFTGRLVEEGSLAGSLHQIDLQNLGDGLFMIYLNDPNQVRDVILRFVKTD
jgi:hypothetical protein